MSKCKTKLMVEKIMIYAFPFELFVACLSVVMEKVMTPLSLWLYRLYRLETTFVHTFMLGVVDCRLDRNSGLQNILYLHIASIPFVYSTIQQCVFICLLAFWIRRKLSFLLDRNEFLCWFCPFYQPRIFTSYPYLNMLL